MKAALYLWKRRLRWVVLLSVILAVLTGVYTYIILPVRYQAVAEVLMLKTDTESLDALADEAIRWSQYDAIRGNTLAAAQWEQTDTSVRRYRNTGILLVKAVSNDAQTAAAAANAMADSLMTVLNKAAAETVLKSVVVAGVPEAPIRFYREKIIAAVLLGAFVLFGLISLLWCMKKPKLIRARDVADTAKLPVLAEIPNLHRMMDAYLRFDPETSPILGDYAGFETHEQLRLISLAIHFRAKRDGLKSLAFVSRTDNEYRSETLVMLAQELCSQGSRVLLVDMNWYQPRLGMLLQAKGEYDIIHCLVSEIPFEKAVVPTQMRNLYFLDQAHSQSMAAQLSASVSFSALLDAMYTKFDYVLLDMPRADLFSDALAIGGTLHACVPVIKAKRWTPKEIARWLEPMQKLERRELGVVVTGASEKKTRARRKLERSGG